MTTSPSPALAINDLNGRVIVPDDPGYDEARGVFLRGIDRRPVAIAQAADTADVARVVALARDTGLPLAVRGGGHSNAGFGTVDGGIVLDLSQMRDIDIDTGQRTAWAGGGMTAGDYTTAAAGHGLATGFGDTPSVGIGGITLGGGLGFLSRKHGLTIDDLLAAEVVTADGQVLQVDAENHPDLFWAIRGGGGNFGVVTRFRFRLHEVDQIFGGLLILPATPEVITGFVERADAAPEELSMIAGVMLAPPMPFVPPEHHGRPVLMTQLVYAGGVEDGEAAVAPIRALATPLADMVRPMRYAEMYELAAGAPQPAGSAMRTMFVDGLGADAAQAILDHLPRSSAPMAAVQLRVLGGAVSRVPADTTAFAHRGRRMMVNVAAMYAQVDEAAVHDRWVAGLAAELRGGEPAAYVGFLGDEGEDRVREAYPAATWERLAAIKRIYDPDNLFRLNQNIPPAAA